MGCVAPRGPGESVGPRRLSGVVVRPLNFTVRGQRADHVRGLVQDVRGLVQESQHAAPFL